MRGSATPRPLAQSLQKPRTDTGRQPQGCVVPQSPGSVSCLLPVWPEKDPAHARQALREPARGAARRGCSAEQQAAPAETLPLDRDLIEETSRHAARIGMLPQPMSLGLSDPHPGAGECPCW